MPKSIKLYSPFLQLIILIVLFIGFAVLTAVFDSIMCPVISGYKITELPGVDFHLPEVLTTMKVFAVTEPIIMYLLPGLLFAMLISAKPVEWLQIDKPVKWQAAVLIVLIMLVILPLQGFLNDWNHSWHLSEGSRMHNARNRAMLKALLKISDFTSLLIVVLITTLSALTKAFFFHGVLQKLFIQLMPRLPWVAIILTATVFSISAFDKYVFASQFLLGLQLSVIVYLTGNLRFSLLGHFIAGIVTIVLVYLYQIGVLLQDPALNAGVAWYSAVISCIVTVALIWYLRKKWPKPVVIIEEDVTVIGASN